MAGLDRNYLHEHAKTVVAFARRSQNPLYAKQLELYEAAHEEYSKVLDKLLMSVKLADSDELAKVIMKADKWEAMTPSQRQLHRIKNGLWEPGSGARDGF